MNIIRNILIAITVVIIINNKATMTNGYEVESMKKGNLIHLY